MKNLFRTQSAEKLLEAILALQNKDEAQIFLRDLLTEEEIKEFSSRFAVARMLSDKVSYKQIGKKTGMSSTTIARISKWLSRGMGGYQLLINRLNSSHHIHTQANLEVDS